MVGPTSQFGGKEDGARNRRAATGLTHTLTRRIAQHLHHLVQCAFRLAQPSVGLVDDVAQLNNAIWRRILPPGCGASHDVERAAVVPLVVAVVARAIFHVGVLNVGDQANRDERIRDLASGLGVIPCSDVFDHLVLLAVLLVSILSMRG